MFYKDKMTLYIDFWQIYAKFEIWMCFQDNAIVIDNAFKEHYSSTTVDNFDETFLLNR